MTKSPARDIAASIHQRLLDKATWEGRPFNEMLQYLAMERVLYRLAQSPHSEEFVLKGALMLSVWNVAAPRPTMDIDLLGRLRTDPSHAVDVIRGICVQPVEDDGFVFDPESVTTSPITEDADYEGVRVRFRGHLGKARVTLQIDIGFGDKVVPRPEDIKFPSILGLPVARLKGYTRESSIAEKCSAILKLGELNSRVKDFFDIWVLSREFCFDGGILHAAIQGALSKRSINPTLPPVAFTDLFARNPTKESQWKGFLRKNHLSLAPRQFPEVVSSVQCFLTPVLEAIVDKRNFPCFWQRSGPWELRRLG